MGSLKFAKIYRDLHLFALSCTFSSQMPQSRILLVLNFVPLAGGKWGYCQQALVEGLKTANSEVCVQGVGFEVSAVKFNVLWILSGSKIALKRNFRDGRHEHIIPIRCENSIPFPILFGNSNPRDFRCLGKQFELGCIFEENNQDLENLLKSTEIFICSLSAAFSPPKCPKVAF